MGNCFRYLLLHNRLYKQVLNTTYIYYLPVLWIRNQAQLNQFFCSLSNKAAINVSVGLHSFLNLEIFFQALVVVGRIPCDCRTELSVEDGSLLLEGITDPCQKALPWAFSQTVSQYGSLCHQAQQENLLVESDEI